VATHFVTTIGRVSHASMDARKVLDMGAVQVAAHIFGRDIPASYQFVKVPALFALIITMPHAKIVASKDVGTCLAIFLYVKRHIIPSASQLVIIV
jgi:hypothetical protein